MRIAKMVLSVAVVCLVALTSVSARSARLVDMTGTYVGALNLEGQGPLPTELQIKQDGDKITGKIGDGAKPAEMLPVTGEVDDDEVTLTAKPPQGEMHIEMKLTLTGAQLKGDGVFVVGDMKIKFTAEMKKK